MHKFPTDASLASNWSKAICIYRADWTGPSSSSRLCSLHFTSDCYDSETIMRKKMRLEDKRLNLKEGSIPTLFPSKKDIDAGSETWTNQSQSHAATQVPPPLSSAYEWPSKHDVIARHKSRYSQSQ